MSAEFLPPMPSYTPPSGDGSGNINQSQGFNLAPSSERDRVARSVARSAKIRTATSAVVQTRAQFVAYLKQGGLDLWTSAVEFQSTADFILSSYVIYTNHNNFKEPLTQFLQRYPNLQSVANSIKDQLRPTAVNMQVVTPKGY